MPYKMHIYTLRAITFYIISEAVCGNLHWVVRTLEMVHFYTMPSAQEIYDALEQRRLTLGLSQAEVGARAFGKPDNSAFQALRRGSSPSAEKLSALCRAVGWEFYFGPPRDMDDSSSPPAAAEVDFAKIPLHAALLAAGDGADNGVEQIVDYLAFRRDWLRRIGVAPGNAALARVDGESMQPSIWHGDMVMVDRSQIEIQVRARATESRHRSPVYALLEDGKARVKRLERPTEDQLVLISDNPEYAPQFVRPGTVRVIGKVVWWGHTARE